MRDVFPAHAGMNRIFDMNTDITGRVPRTRGDEPAIRLMDTDGAECSPHTRG